jgi:hypothetical protein
MGGFQMIRGAEAEVVERCREIRGRNRPIDDTSTF